MSLSKLSFYRCVKFHRCNGVTHVVGAIRAFTKDERELNMKECPDTYQNWVLMEARGLPGAFFSEESPCIAFIREEKRIKDDEAQKERAKSYMEAMERADEAARIKAREEEAAGKATRDKQAFALAEKAVETARQEYVNASGLRCEAEKKWVEAREDLRLLRCEGINGD